MSGSAPRQSTNIVWRIVEDEAFILDLTTGNYYCLNPVATRMWCLLQEGKPVDDIVSDITSCYDVSQETAKADLNEFLNLLNQEKLVES